jgi:predicted metal-binding membrane protein
MASDLEAVLRRHRAITIAALILLTLLAWAWLWAGAGMDMGRTMGGGGMAGMTMPSPPEWHAVLFLMWWSMMVAMMLPSAAPMILLYARAASNGPSGARPSTGMFLTGYLVAWGFFSLAASGLQFLLERTSLLSPAAMILQSHRLSGAFLLVAGIYQLSPLKNACLRQCRNPAQFLSAHYRTGAAGALRMGMVHGTYCIGCCWLLMALLFVGGVMNLAWIALLTLAVAAEKLLPQGRLIGMGLGLSCIGWGGYLIAT